MLIKKKYSIFCDTCGITRYGWTLLETPPTECPINAAHVVRENTKTIVEFLVLDNPDAETEPTKNDDVTCGYAVGSFWICKNTKTEYVCLDNAQGAAVWLVRSFGPITVQSLEESSTTSSAWQDKLSITTPVLFGNFIFTVSFEAWVGSASNKIKVRCRSVTDSSNIAKWASKETDVTNFSSLSTISFSNQSKTIVLQFQSQIEGQTSYIANAQMVLLRMD